MSLKDTIKNIPWLPASFAILVFFGLAIFAVNQEKKELFGGGDKAFKDSILDYKVKGDEIEYVKLTDKEIGAVSFGKIDGKDVVEDISLRTNNIQTAIIGKDKDNKEKRISKVFAGAPMAKIISSGKWYEVEITTTTATDFNQKMSSTWKEKIRENLVDVVWAITTSTYVGDAATAGTIGYETEVDWATAHDASTGTYVQSLTTIAIEVYNGDYIDRGVTNFSLVGLTGTITSSSLNLYAKSTWADADNDGNDYINIVNFTAPDSETLLAVADYNNFGTTVYSTGKDLTTEINTTLMYYNWKLNSAGQTEIQNAVGIGNAHFGIREGHDIVNSASGAGSNSMYFGGKTSPFSNQPYLSIEYTVGGAVVIQPTDSFLQEF